MIKPLLSWTNLIKCYKIFLDQSAASSVFSSSWVCSGSASFSSPSACGCSSDGFSSLFSVGCSACSVGCSACCSSCGCSSVCCSPLKKI
jgi:hypothetical protein